MTSPRQKSAKKRFVEVADSVSGFNEKSMGDEREAHVILRAYTFALVSGTFLLTVAGALLALFGYWGFALGAVLFGGLQSYLAIGYAAANSVSLFALEKKTSQKRKRIALFVYLGVLAVLLGARGFQMFTGRPVFGSYGVGQGSAVDPTDFWSTVAGAIVGLLAVLIGKKILDRRTSGKEDDFEDLDE